MARRNFQQPFSYGDTEARRKDKKPEFGFGCSSVSPCLREIFGRFFLRSASVLGSSVAKIEDEIDRHHDKIEAIKEQNPFVIKDSVGDTAGVSDQHKPQKDRTLPARLLGLEHFGDGKRPRDPKTEDHEKFENCDSIRHGRHCVRFASAGSMSDFASISLVPWVPQKSRRQRAVSKMNNTEDTESTEGHRESPLISNEIDFLSPL